MIEFNFKNISNYSIEEIYNQLLIWNYSYRTGDPIVSDIDYDHVYNYFKDNCTNPQWMANLLNEPDDIERDDIKPISMKGLNEVKNIIQLNKKISPNTEVILTPKYNGISILYDESNGKAWTRGDGEKGRRSDTWLQLITKPSSKSLFISYGELIVKQQTFKDIYVPQGVSNVCSFVSGLINKKPSNDLKNVDYLRYGIGDSNLSKEEQLIELNKINEVKVPYIKININDLTHEYIESLYNEWSKDYSLDGIVVDINDSKLREELGKDENNEPKYTFKYKADFETKVSTKINNITWTVQKYGNVTPVVNVDTVLIDGKELTNPTGNNANHLLKFGLAIGEEVLVKFSGTVIPKIIGVNGTRIPDTTDTIEDLQKLDKLILERKDTKVDLPTHCPSCNSKLIWDKNHVHLKCTDVDNCTAIQLKRIVAFFGICGVDGFKESTIKVLFDSGYNTIEKILSMNKKQFLSLDKFADTKAETVYNNIHTKCDEVELSLLQHASSMFDGLGSKILTIINTYIKTNPNFTVKDLIELDKVSDITAQIYLDNIDNFNNWYKKHEHLIKIQNSTNKITIDSTKLESYTVVFSQIRDKELASYIVNNAGTVASGISKNVTHLIVKDETALTSKAIKARDMGITIIGIEQFKTLVDYKVEDNNSNDIFKF